MPTELKIVACRSAREFRTWLEKNHAGSDGILLRMYKKDSAIPSLTYAEALDQALCFGWIDGQKNSYDEHSWLQKFTPRRPRSRWSRNNTQHVERLIKSGEMTAAGLKEIDAAKSDGRWETAYTSARNSTIPTDFLRALAQNKKAKAFFKTLNKTNLYAITYRLQTGKPETRAKRIQSIIERLAREEPFH